MAKTSTLAIKIVSDAKDAKRGFDDAESSAGRLSGKLGALGAVAAVAGGAVIAVGIEAFNAASNLQQQVGAVDAIFGSSAGRMHEFAATAATTAGLSQAAYSEMAAVMGAQLGNAGFAGDELAGKVNGLIGTGADLAAQFGGSTQQAVEALSSAFKGETDPIERYGVSIKQADINAQLAKMGMEGLTGEAAKQAQAMAVMSLVTDQTATAQGAFARESDTAATKQQVLAAQVENLKAKIGDFLLPIVSDLFGWISEKIIPTFERWTEEGGPLTETLDKIGAFIRDQVMPVISDLWSFLQDKVVPIWQDVAGVIRDIVIPALDRIWAFVRDYVVPIFKSTLGPALDGVRDAFRTVTEKIDDNRDTFDRLYKAVEPVLAFLRDKVAPFVGGALKKAFETAGDVIGGLIDSVAWILDKGAAVMEWVGGVFGASGGGEVTVRGAAPRAAGTYTGAAPRLFGSSSPAGGAGPLAGGGPILAPSETWNITITGVLDADDAAERIERLLERRARFTGRTLAAALS